LQHAKALARLVVILLSAIHEEPRHCHRTRSPRPRCRPAHTKEPARDTEHLAAIQLNLGRLQAINDILTGLDDFLIGERISGISRRGTKIG
jgi:hypothetical protein